MTLKLQNFKRKYFTAACGPLTIQRSRALAHTFTFVQIEQKKWQTNKRCEFDTCTLLQWRKRERKRAIAEILLFCIKEKKMCYENMAMTHYARFSYRRPFHISQKHCELFIWNDDISNDLKLDWRNSPKTKTKNPKENHLLSYKHITLYDVAPEQKWQLQEIFFHFYLTYDAYNHRYKKKEEANRKEKKRRIFELAPPKYSYYKVDTESSINSGLHISKVSNCDIE